MADGEQQVIDKTTSSGKRLFPISMAVANYDRTRALLDGRVKPEGIDLDVISRYVGEFCIEPVYEQYDAAEMSFSWYVMARSRNEPVMALPIFPLRMPVFAYVFVDGKSSLTEPRQLKGKRIAVGSYRYTVNLWLRGIFGEHYGLAPEEVKWVTCTKDEGAGFNLPAGVDITVVDGATPEDLLARGEVDAIFATKLPTAYIEGDQSLRHLNRKAQA
jgi:4,5-dihydroxyphthalate decarboxylase